MYLATVIDTYSRNSLQVMHSRTTCEAEVTLV